MMNQIFWEESKLNRSLLDDKVSLAKRCCDGSFGYEQLPMQRYYGGKWYRFNGDGYEQIGNEEASQLVTKSLIHCYEIKGQSPRSSIATLWPFCKQMNAAVCRHERIKCRACFLPGKTQVTSCS